MTEDEILIRAREAVIAAQPHTFNADAQRNIRSGNWDYPTYGVPQAAQALRDLSKPLDELRPVDPDLIAAREVVCGYHHDKYLDESPWHANRAARVRAGSEDRMLDVQAAYFGIKRGRELERGNP